MEVGGFERINELGQQGFQSGRAYALPEKVNDGDWLARMECLTTGAHTRVTQTPLVLSGESPVSAWPAQPAAPPPRNASPATFRNWSAENGLASTAAAPRFWAADNIG